MAAIAYTRRSVLKPPVCMIRLRYGVREERLQHSRHAAVRGTEVLTNDFFFYGPI